MRLDPRRLAVLRAVADAGGVLAAAGALRLTPSAVSQHIARLEAETGVTLLDRSRLGGRRAVRLTPAGLLLARHAGHLADVLAEAERDLAALTGQIAGAVRVGAFPSGLRRLVLPAAGTVGPRVALRIVQIEPEPGLAALRAGALDLLLIDGDAADPAPAFPGLRVSALLDDPYQLATPRGWGAANSVEDLLARPWIDGPSGSAARRALDRIAAHYGVTLNRAHECLEYPVALDIAAAGLAAAVVPTLLLPGEPDPGVRLLVSAVLGARRVSLVHKRGRPEPGPAVHLVAEAIRAVAADVAESGR